MHSWTAGSSPNSNKDTWVIVCGYGLKHSSEECEDNNTVDSDGWNSTCQIKSGFIWTGVFFPLQTLVHNEN